MLHNLRFCWWVYQKWLMVTTGVQVEPCGSAKPCSSTEHHYFVFVEKVNHVDDVLICTSLCLSVQQRKRALKLWMVCESQGHSKDVCSGWWQMSQPQICSSLGLCKVFSKGVYWILRTWNVNHRMLRMLTRDGVISGDHTTYSRLIIDVS